MPRIKSRYIKVVKDYDEAKAEKYSDWRDRIQVELREAEEQGYHTIFLDEFLVTKSTVRRFEYCRPGENHSYQQSALSEPVEGMILAASYEKGLDYSEMFNYSVDGDRFQDYIMNLVTKYPKKKLCLFMDSLPAHKEKLTQ